MHQLKRQLHRRSSTGNSSASSDDASPLPGPLSAPRAARPSRLRPRGPTFGPPAQQNADSARPADKPAQHGDALLHRQPGDDDSSWQNHDAPQQVDESLHQRRRDDSQTGGESPATSASDDGSSSLRHANGLQPGDSLGADALDSDDLDDGHDSSEGMSEDGVIDDSPAVSAPEWPMDPGWLASQGAPTATSR